MSLSTSRRDFPHERIEIVQAILLGWFPALVAFVLIPLDLYLPNQGDWGLNIGLLLPFLLISLLCVLVVSVLMRTTPRYGTSLCVALFYLGVFMALTDLLFPVRTHSAVAWEAALPVGVEAFAAVALVICFRMISFKLVRTVGSVFVAIILVLQILTVPGRISPDSILAVGGNIVYEPSARPQKLSGNSTGPNIYHLVFDELGSSVFEEAVTSEVIEGLDGFTYFRNARANYIWTNYSMASFLTGAFYSTGNIEEWLNRRKSGGVQLKLADAGYCLTQYIPTRFYMHDRASRLVDSVDVTSKHGVSESTPGVSDFLDLWLDRVVPHCIGAVAALFWNSGRSEASPHQDSGLQWAPGSDDELTRFLAGERSANLQRKRWIRKIYNSLPLMSRLISDESSRPGRGQYVFLHTYVTHLPHDVLDEECRLCRGMKPRDQARCALKFVRRFTDKLKELGRYHRSVIIIQADHGPNTAGPSDPGLRMPAKILDEMVSGDGLPGDLLYNRTFPLLLVKPPNTSGDPIRTSESPVQLADIPATLCGFLGLQGGKGIGRSVFSIEESEEREIHMFFGFARRDKHGTVYWAGKQHGAGKAFHVSFTPGKGYKKYPRIPFQWE